MLANADLASAHVWDDTVALHVAVDDDVDVLLEYVFSVEIVVEGGGGGGRRLTLGRATAVPDRQRARARML